jgi:hypothetical protein
MNFNELSFPGGAAPPNPESTTPVCAYEPRLWLWIPGSGFAGPGMTQQAVPVYAASATTRLRPSRLAR